MLPRSLRLVLGGIAVAYGVAAADLKDDPEAFKAVAVPLIHNFIFSRYSEFAASELTFRHLKNHVASELPVTYEDLKRDDLSEVIETATDEIANKCDMGDVPISVCKMRIGYEEQKAEL
jgi:hypothetical protein